MITSRYVRSIQSIYPKFSLDQRSYLDKSNHWNFHANIQYSDWTQDPYQYNVPTASDITAIMISNRYDVNLSNKDILLRLRDRGL